MKTFANFSPDFFHYRFGEKGLNQTQKANKLNKLFTAVSAFYDKFSLYKVAGDERIALYENVVQSPHGDWGLVVRPKRDFLKIFRGGTPQGRKLRRGNVRQREHLALPLCTWIEENLKAVNWDEPFTPDTRYLWVIERFNRYDNPDYGKADTSTGYSCEVSIEVEGLLDHQGVSSAVGGGDILCTYRGE